MVATGADRSRQHATGAFSGFERGTSNAEFQEQVIDALAVRLGAAPVERQANPLRNCSVLEIGRRFYEEGGVSVRSLDDARIAELMTGSTSSRAMGGGFRGGLHTTSDFTFLMDTAANRALLARFGAVSSPLKALATKRNARDFRQQSFIRPGEAPKLEKVPESGEVKSGTLSEDSRGFKIDTYAKKFGLSRQAIINDDLGAFADFIRAFGDSAAETEGDLLFGLLSANAFSGANYSDGKPFFHVDHANKASSGSAIDVAAVDAGRMAMRLQKNVNGTGTAGVVPSVLLVGPKKETEAQKFVAEINATSTSDVNPFAGRLSVAVENRYDGIGWWLFGSAQERPAIAYGYLDGQEGPIIQSKEGWDVLGTEFRCILDFGCGVFDFKAAYFNPGT